MSPFDQQVIQHYTVFWCKKQSSERCSLALNWEIVQPNITSINITTDKNSGDYEVYISVDGFNGRSSGLCRSPCQVKADDVGKLA